MHATQAARTANTGKLTGITQGSWEAEGKVIVVRPENKSGEPNRTMILYEGSVINCGEPKNSGLNSQKAELESELEVNARAIAAVPDMLSLLKDLLIITATRGNMPREYDLKIVELLLNIYDADSVIIDNDRIILTREAREDGNHNGRDNHDNHDNHNCRNNHNDHEDHYEKQSEQAKQVDNFVFSGECKNCKYCEECECADYNDEDDEDCEDDENDEDKDSVADNNRGRYRVKNYIFQL